MQTSIHLLLRIITESIAEGALVVFLLMDGIDMESFSASQFCQTLFQNIKNGGEDKDRE